MSLNNMLSPTRTLRTTGYTVVLILETQIQNTNNPRYFSCNGLSESLLKSLLGLLMHSQSSKLDTGQALAHNLYC